MAEAYPLHWPDGWPKSRYREDSRFKTTFGKARDNLFKEIRMLGGTLPVLSTNVELRNDGLPYANRLPSGSPGASVYFSMKKNQMCFACDKYYRVQENIQAIRKTIEALRGIERWGASDMMERAFSGFAQLSDLSNSPWWQVLGVDKDDMHEAIKRAYQYARSSNHPDNGGDSNEFDRVQKAWKQYNEERANG